MKIVDLMGRIIYGKDQDFDDLEIDLSGYESGIYCIKIQTDKYQLSRKVFKQ